MPQIKSTTLLVHTQTVWHFMDDPAPEFVRTAVREALTREAEKAGLPAPTFSHEELNAPKGENTFAMLQAIIKRAARREQAVNTSEQARAIESLLTKPRAAESVKHTLRAILVELSNESETGVDSPGVAGAFYRAAAENVPALDRRWARIHAEQALRHIDVLLNTPTAATAKVLIRYWDDSRSKDLKTDPFPAKPDPFRLKRKTKR